MAAKTTAPRNFRYLTAKTIVTGFVLGAMVISYTHIVHLFAMLGLHGWQGNAAPAFIDGFVLLGILGRGEQFASRTRRTGLMLQIAATLVSLAANIAAGDSLGARIFGALVVVGYVVAEWYSDQLKPATAEKAETVKATRSAAAQKAAATRKANADAARQAATIKAAAAKARRDRKAQTITADDAQIDTRAYL